MREQRTILIAAVAAFGLILIVQILGLAFIILLSNL